MNLSAFELIWQANKLNEAKGSIEYEFQKKRRVENTNVEIYEKKFPFAFLKILMEIFDEV